MKKAAVFLMFLNISFGLSAQQQSPAPTTPPIPSANPPPSTLPAQRVPAQTQPIPQNTAQNPSLATNQFQTNALTPTGIPAFEQSNALQTAAGTQPVNFSITNTLSRMAPAQATNVIQVQNGLTILQTIATTIGQVQNVQQVVQTPQIQQQVQQVSGQLSALALGPVKPSQEITFRLTQDLLRAFGPARLTNDRLLVLAIVIDHTFNSGTLSAGQIDDTINTGMADLQTAGVPMALLHPVTCDLHSVAYELQPALAR